MSKIIFNFKGEEITLLCKKEEKMKDIIKRLGQKIQKNMNKIYLIYDGKIVNEELKVDEIIKAEDKERNIMNSLVEEIEEFKDISDQNIVKSNDIICPKCKENILIEFNDFNINLYKCKNGHELNNLSIKDFQNFQYINLSHIICDICNDKNKGSTYKNEFYYCLTCRKNICPLCKTLHDQSHFISNYENKDYFCGKHNENFIKYCKQCNQNICMKCETEHKNHSLIYFGDLLPDDDKIKEIEEFKNDLDKFNIDIKNMIKIFENVIDNINSLYNICNDYIKRNIDKRNFITLTNINEIINNNNNFFKEIKSLMIDNIMENRIKNLIDIYHRINNNNNNMFNNNTIYNSNILENESTNYIIAQIDINSNNLNTLVKIINSFEHYKKENNIKEYIQNEENFLNENEIKNNCIIKINDKIIPFSYYYKFTKKGNNKVEFIFTKKLKNINHIFAECFYKNLDLSKLNVTNIVNMSYSFYNCRNLNDLNLSNLNFENLVEIENIFQGCYSLLSLNLSGCKIPNVTNMSHLFQGCYHLAYLNLSSFNTQKVLNMSYMFNGCSSLTSLGLSNFNTENVNDMSNMFAECSSLKNLDLSNFNTENVTNMSNMFAGCKSLLNLTVTNFNTENVNDMNYMFNECSSLTNLDLTSFHTQNVKEMKYIFGDCKSLAHLNLSNFEINCSLESYCYCDYPCSCKKNIFNNCDSLTKGNIIANDKKLKRYINDYVTGDCYIF